MVRMDVGDDHGVDVGRIDAGGGQRLRQFSRQRTNLIGIAGIDQDELVAGVDQPFVEGGRCHLLGGDEGVLQQLGGAVRIAGKYFVGSAPEPSLRTVTSKVPIFKR